MTGTRLPFGIRLAGRLLPRSIPLVFKAGKTVIKFKWNARKGVKTFEKELYAQGLDDDVAIRLTELYKKGSQITKRD